jgi:oligopeptide/dipeptide ABC transporter ATP-binding protein
VTPTPSETVLDVRGLAKHFGHRSRGRRALDGVDLTIGRGEIVGVVGESGSGKSTLARTVARLHQPTEGTIEFDGVDLATLKGKPLRAARRRMQMIFQNPMTSLDPRRTVESSIAEPLHEGTKAERRAIVLDAVDAVGLSREHLDRYPGQLSGGQRQRVCVARALVADPLLVLADEPTSSLDVSTQAQIVNLLLELQRERQMSFLFITHNLALADHLCHRVVVMYAGRVVESATAEDLFASAAHPYARVLLETTGAAVGDSVRPTEVEADEVPGWTGGCAYRLVCPAVHDRCHQEAPVLAPIAPGHEVACHLVPPTRGGTQTGASA